jgi:hypothetical protein
MILIKDSLQNARVFDWQHICHVMFYNSLHSYEYQLCSPVCPLVPLFVRDMRQAVASQDKQNETSLVF